MGRVFIVRHGQTDLNKQKIMQGRINSQLNEEGRGQAATISGILKEKGIRFDLVYSSPLQRARSTAEIIVGSDAEITVDERLVEMEYGPYEGSSLVDPPAELAKFFEDFSHNAPPEGMETLEEVVERAGAFMMDIREEAREKDILVSTHAITMKGILEFLNPERNGSYWDKFIGNCSVYCTEYKDGRFSIPEEVARLSKTAREIEVRRS